MTEQQLRQRVADIIDSWMGATKGSAVHLEILNIYNSHKPLARNYTVTPQDEYCATTVSAAWIKAGIAEYTGTECGVEKFVQIAKQKGYWTEDDAYVPKMGDAIVYDWNDTGAGDNTGYSDHIGLVTKPGNPNFTTTEGNINGSKVDHKYRTVNGRYIRGYITPDYAAIAKALEPEAAPAPTTQEAVKVGDLVAIKPEAAYYNGTRMPDWVKADKWYVKSLTGDRAVIDENAARTKGICSPVNIKFLEKAEAPTIQVGSKVRLKEGAMTYDGKRLASFVYKRNHTVKAINGQRVVITYLGITIAAVNKKDLVLA